MSLGMKEACARAIRELRGRRRQEDCAAAAGVTARSWSRWESGKVLPEEASLGAIARGLGVGQRALGLAITRHFQEILAEEPPLERGSIDGAEAPFVLDALVRDELYEMADRLWQLSGGGRADLPEPRRLKARQLLRAGLLHLVGAFQVLDPAARAPSP